MNLRARIESANENLIAAILGISVFAFHAWHIPAIARAPLFRHNSLVFDFDDQRFVGLWTATPFPTSLNEDSYGTRHPLAVVLRLACRPLVQAGLDPNAVGSGVAAICAALSAVFIFKIARALAISRLSAALLTALWAVSTTTLMLGILPEAYGLALAGLTLQFLVSLRWMTGARIGFAARIAMAVLNFGITVTNAGLSGLAEFFGRASRTSLRHAFTGTLRFGVIAGSVALLLSAVSFYVWPVENIHTPLAALKRVYWSAEAPAHATGVIGIKQGFANVAWTLAGTSFVAPAVAKFPSGDPAPNAHIWDLRGQRYSVVGWAAVIGWFAILLYGAVAALSDRRHWPFWATAAAWVVFNLLLHDYWQYRGSVLVYAAHSNSAFFMLALAGAIAPSRPRVYQALVAVVALLTAVNNFPLYHSLSKLGPG